MFSPRRGLQQYASIPYGLNRVWGGRQGCVGPGRPAPRRGGVGILLLGRLDLRRGIAGDLVVLYEGCSALAFGAQVFDRDAHSRQGFPDPGDFEIEGSLNFWPWSRELVNDLRHGCVGASKEI